MNEAEKREVHVSKKLTDQRTNQSSYFTDEQSETTIVERPEIEINDGEEDQPEVERLLVWGWQVGSLHS